MRFNNKIFSKLAIAGVLLLLIIQGSQLVSSFMDLVYLNKIVEGKDVSASEYAFYMQRDSVYYWLNLTGVVIYLVLFLTWFYRAYSNVYVRESEQAPFKRGLVPFSLIIPIMNLYAPYQIMKFIWWGNSYSVDHLEKGYKTIRLWWGLTIVHFILAFVYSYKLESGGTLLASDYINLAYLGIIASIVVSCRLLLTRKLIVDITQQEKASLQPGHDSQPIEPGQA
jgi:hypothetical protein